MFLAMFIFSGTSSWAQVKSQQKQLSSHAKALKVINDYVANLLPEEEWRELVVDFVTVDGNYCSDEYDASFRKACLSQLDCLCKEHNFGYALTEHRNADKKFAEQIFSITLKDDDSKSYQHYIQTMVLAYFAGKITGKNLYKPILSAYNIYKRDHKQGIASLANLINSTQVVKEAILDIKSEKEDFETRQSTRRFETGKTMAVSIQPFNLIFGLVSLSYEYKIRDWVSIKTGLGFYGSGLITETYLTYGNDKNFSIFGGFEAKFYVMGSAMKSGLYLSPGTEFGYESVLNKASGAVVQELAIVPAVLLGFDKVFSSGISLDAGIGMGYHYPVHYFAGKSPADFKTSFVVPKFQASVGYAW